MINILPTHLCHVSPNPSSPELLVLLPDRSSRVDPHLLRVPERQNYGPKVEVAAAIVPDEVDRDQGLNAEHAGDDLKGARDVFEEAVRAVLGFGRARVPSAKVDLEILATGGKPGRKREEELLEFVEHSMARIRVLDVAAPRGHAPSEMVGWDDEVVLLPEVLQVSAILVSLTADASDGEKVVHELGYVVAEVKFDTFGGRKEEVPDLLAQFAW